MASPCDWMDLPQTYMEPLLVTYASNHGFDIRFNTEVVSIEAEPDRNFLCTLRDLTTKHAYQIRSRFLFGADGARSVVARSFERFTFNKAPSKGSACNVLFRADLTHLMENGVRPAMLHSIINPPSSRIASLGLGMFPIVRMVRHWNLWMLGCVALGGNEGGPKPLDGIAKDSPQLIEYIKDLIGDHSVEVEVLRVDPWVIRETAADRYSLSAVPGERELHKVFILGDAAHRHPPTYGLGSNTCVQDAYNLAWKVAYVSRGWAGPELLETYSVERQPVGTKVVKESNIQLTQIGMVLHSLGVLGTSEDDKIAQLAELDASTPGGAVRRAMLHAALEGMRKEGDSLGFTMNQWYGRDSTAVYLTDEPGPRPEVDGDPIVKPLISTYPGTRLPHAWLDIPTRRKEISTQNLAGHGAFCLFTGHGGEGWRVSAAELSEETGIPINMYGIGFGLDYHDVYREWYKRREVDEDGCVLVRPDRVVAWRSVKMVPDCKVKLQAVLDSVLSRRRLGE